jgi:hypothetical protein
MTLSTHLVGFLSFLAQYFSWHPFYPMFTGLMRGGEQAPSFANPTSRDRQKAVAGITEPVWFRLRR